MSSTSSSTSSLFTPLTFTGVSKYSSDFQSIVDRAVSIASLPLTQMQNDQTDLLAKKQLLTDLGSAAGSVGDSVTALGKLGANRGINATSSNTDKLTINSTNADASALYTITDVSSIAHSASETSLTGYATSDSSKVSASGNVQLIFGATGSEKSYSITLDSAHNNLVGLRDAINNLNVGVSANVLTTGTGTNPNYLSVSSNTNGAQTLRLVENPGTSQSDMLTSTNQGADTVFKLNGVTVRKSSTLINDVVPGVSFNLLATTDTNESLAITLSSDGSSIASALQTLVSNYNTAVGKVDAQIGQSAGLLSGDSVVREVQSSLRALVNYSGTGNIKSLAEIGIELDTNGQMSFNQDTFNALSSSQIDDAFTFLGSATTGLGALASKFTTLSDPVTGIIKLQQDQYDKTDTRLTDQISAVTTRISDMQTTLSEKLQAADELLSSLESQQTLLTSTINSLNFTLYGTNTSTATTA